MQVVNDTRGGFDSEALAQLLTQPRRQGQPPVPVAVVSRPIFLSDTLRGDCRCHSESLGFVNLDQGTNEGNLSVLGTISTGMNFVPVVGPIASSALNIFTQAVSFFRNWLGIGAGRIEADAIVPTQNNIAARLDQITDNILVSQNPTVGQLQAFYRELWQIAVAFMEFVLMPDFTDRRASGQALNTLMPYINGTCGYDEPLGMTIVSTSLNSNCLTWGAGTLGGPGTDGMMGAIARAITAQGGSVPELPNMYQAANSGFDVSEAPPTNGNEPPILAGFSSPLAVAIGVLSLFMFSRKRGR